MAMRTVNDCYAGGAPLVDKMLGNAFLTVQAVSDNLGQIRYIADNMQAVIALAGTLTPETSLLVRGVVGALGSTTLVPLPTGVNPANVHLSTVILTTPAGTVYFSDSGVFSAKIIAGNLSLTTSPTAPSDVAAAAFCWRLVVGV